MPRLAHGITVLPDESARHRNFTAEWSMRQPRQRGGDVRAYPARLAPPHTAATSRAGWRRDDRSAASGPVVRLPGDIPGRLPAVVRSPPQFPPGLRRRAPNRDAAAAPPPGAAGPRPTQAREGPRAGTY